jgi:hypothetical protein
MTTPLQKIVNFFHPDSPVPVAPVPRLEFEVQPTLKRPRRTKLFQPELELGDRPSDVSPEEYRDAFFTAVDDLLDLNPTVTGEDVRRQVGMPASPSRVGSLMLAASKIYDLQKVATKTALGRHQHYLTIWSRKAV